MYLPVIGLTTRARDEQKRYGLNYKYIEAVRRAGGMPILIPHGEADVEALASLLDGLVLSGGGDIDPSFFDGASHPMAYQVDMERDRTELALVEHFVRDRRPLLAICRGAQVVNVALGGTLHAHVPEVYGERIAHRSADRSFIPHAITARANSRVAEAMGVTTCSPSSCHHQAIDRLADALVQTAEAPDGVIEAFEMPGHPHLLAVQWHPEDTAETDPDQQHLFDWLVAAAREAAPTASRHTITK